MTRGVSRKICENCGNMYYGGNTSRYCHICRQSIYYTCSDCGLSKKHKYSTWCYPCSLKHRDTSRYGKSIKKAIEAARSPEARKKRSKSLKGHSVSDEVKQKISKANTGKKHSLETKTKMSRQRKGKSKPISFRQKMSDRFSGESNLMWKGGISPSKYGNGWTDRVKDKVRARDNNTCQDCSKNGLDNDGEKLSVHHIDFSKDNHSLDNLVTLCKSCHSKRHKVIKNITGEKK